MSSQFPSAPAPGGAQSLRVGIIGTSGYAGGELLRLLHFHPAAEVCWVASRSHGGRPVSEVFPALAHRTDLLFKPLDIEAMADECDVVFAAVPHGVSMELAPVVVAAGKRYVDLGADFRFADPAAYEQAYARPHTAAALLAEAAYGLPEWFPEAIRKAPVVGNPGCYPTAVLLALAPFARAGLLPPGQPVAVAAMSGVSGAGSQPAPMYHFPDCTENVQPYGVPTHRHRPEMEQGLRALAGSPVPVTFVPHLVPMSRGILATCLFEPSRGLSQEEAAGLMHAAYDQAPFVRVLGPDRLPQTKAVYGSNFCDLTVRVDRHTGQVIALAAIDNLVKGAAGQAIQNMNLMFGLPESTGLMQPGLMP